MCGPRGLKGAPDHLFRNNRDGTFTDVSQAAGVADSTGLYGFGVAWVDLDDDGRLDLFVANDSGPNYVYRNAGGGRFDDVSYPSGAALDAQGREQAHMGVAVGDYDNDGRDDLHVTNFANDFNVLYHNDGHTFTDTTTSTGLTLSTTPFLGWGTDFLDYDNDGWLDLLVVNGHIYPAADRLPWNTSYAQRALLFRNVNGKRFEDLGAAAGEVFAAPRVSRGSAVGDIDNDGGIDVAINNLDAAPTLARNDGGAKGRPLDHHHAERRSRKEVPARRHRVCCVRDRGRRAPPGRGGERPRPDVAVGSARARGPRDRDLGVEPDRSMGERSRGGLRRRPGGRLRHDRSGERRHIREMSMSGGGRHPSAAVRPALPRPWRCSRRATVRGRTGRRA